MGRDHTIFALAKGFVRYYKDPEKHHSRKYIGIVFEQEMSLPRGRNAARRRRLGMEAREMVVETVPKVVGDGLEKSDMRLRDGYQYRESNFSIGRSAERAGVQVPKFDPKDRFLAWRKLNERKLRNAEKRGLRKK